MSIFSRRKRPVSMTIEDDAIRVVRLKSVDPLVIDVVGEVQLPPNVVVEGKIVDSETLATILDGAVKEWGIAKQTIQFLTPDQYVIIRKVPYPDDVMVDELKGHFFIEIGSTLYLPFDDPIFDVVPYIPNTETNEAIVIASKESLMNEYEDVFKDVKLDLIKADISPLALYRLAYKQHKFTGTEHVLLADWLDGKLTVSIFHEHYPLFMRPLDVKNSADLSVITDSTIDSSVVTPLTIVMELEKLISFYRYNMWNGTASITNVLVNGDYEEMDDLLTLIRERLNIHANTLVKESMQLVSGEAVSVRYNRVIGLALKEV